MLNRITPTAGVLQVVSEDVSDSDGSPVSTPKPTAEVTPGALPDVGGTVHADVERSDQWPGPWHYTWTGVNLGEPDQEINGYTLLRMEDEVAYSGDLYDVDEARAGNELFAWIVTALNVYEAAAVSIEPPTSLADSPPTLHEGTETPLVSEPGQDFPLPPNDQKPHERGSVAPRYPRTKKRFGSEAMYTTDGQPNGSKRTVVGDAGSMEEGT